MPYASLLTTGTSTTAVDTMSPIIMMVIIFAAFYFLFMRPQKKRDQEAQKMRDSVQVGDEVVTTGGIVGIVTSVKEDTVVVETGADRCRIRFVKGAIAQNVTATEKANAEREAAKKAKDDAKKAAKEAKNKDK